VRRSTRVRRICGVSTLPLGPPGDAPATHAARPDSPSTPGARVLDRCTSVLAGYHPSKRPGGTVYDRAQIRTKAARTSPERIPGPRLPRRGPQDRARPAGWQSCLGRLPKPPENDKIAFRRDWHKLEMPQPPRRPAQTRTAPPEPASSIGAHRCWLGTTPPEGRSERYATAPRSVQRLPGLAQIRYQDSAYLAMGLRPAGGHRRSNTAVGDSMAASKMGFSRSGHPGTRRSRPSHS
jgi:hypothetical protein